MQREFFESVLYHVPQYIESIVVVTHLIPGVDDFLFALNSKIKVAAVIPKPNSIDERVLSKIESEISVLRYTREQIKKAPSAFIQAIQKKVGSAPFAIIDTGGYFSHVLFELISTPRINLVGIVEDTENGHQKYETLLTKKNGHMASLCPIMSVARSTLKDPEDFLVGQAVVFSADALFREEGMLLTGNRAVVLGYGKIGSSIANCLRTKALRVDVIDNNSVRLALALAHGFHTAKKSELLSSADLIFCATGNQSLEKDDFDVIKDGAFVFTATSADDEIANYKDLLTTARPTRHELVSIVGTSGRNIFLCNNGNSANFMYGGVVGPFIKLVQAELIFALSKIPSMQCGEVQHLSECSKRFIADIWLNNFSLIDRATRTKEH